MDLLGLLSWLRNVEHDWLLLCLGKLLVGLVANWQLGGGTGRCLGEAEILVLVAVSWHWNRVGAIVMIAVGLE